jgi:hypothetical protein
VLDAACWRHFEGRIFDIVLANPWAIFAFLSRFLAIFVAQSKS